MCFACTTNDHIQCISEHNLGNLQAHTIQPGRILLIIMNVSWIIFQIRFFYLICFLIFQNQVEF